VSYLPVYIDSSALLKLVLDEPERDALVEELARHADQVSSVLLALECRRACRRARASRKVLARLEEELATVTLVNLDGPVWTLAGTVGPRDLRSLDAIHLATALSLGDYPEALVTYDDRLAAAARGTGLTVLQPGR
jgi:uncharacterized protein